MIQVPFDFGCDPIKNGRFTGVQSSVVIDFCVFTRSEIQSM